MASFTQEGRYSTFAHGVKNYEFKTNDCKYAINFISASQYLKQRFITRNLLRRFIRYGWVIATKTKGSHISVKEICTEEINDYLNL